MNWLRTVLSELVGLFVDDGALAVAIVAWLALLWWLLPHVAVDGAGKALLLAVGLVVILVESVLRGARRQR